MELKRCTPLPRNGHMMPVTSVLYLLDPGRAVALRRFESRLPLRARGGGAELLDKPKSVASAAMRYIALMVGESGPASKRPGSR